MYVACIQVTPLEGCQINPVDYKGAAVRCYIPSSRKKDAIDKLLDSLNEHKFRLEEIDFLVKDNETVWENPDDETAEQLIKIAEESGRVTYGEFGAWGDDQ